MRSNKNHISGLRQLSFFLLFCFYFLNAAAQSPKSYTSSEILLQLKKLNVLGSVLYIAAHPDDENTRLLAYLANDRLYRTGYLSLTRGDGGQNLIGDEQGVDLGLIRTQELLAARRIDGAEQFFSTAFDFGYSKSPEEALRIWDHNKILSDAVWVIRKFRPDVIITRFPTTGEGGHGHHTASAIIAGEAFEAAADPAKFPEQLKEGVTTWQAKRLLWNTFNFGGTNTQNENQFKLDCGDYNPVLGKSYGEIAAESRSQHKSQGFGVPAQRGAVLEYFKTIKGDAPIIDLMDGVTTGWNRTGSMSTDNNTERAVSSIIKNFEVEHPERSVTALVNLYESLSATTDSYWKTQKQKEMLTIIEACSGLFMEATTPAQMYVRGDSTKINLVVNNRLGININRATVPVGDTYYLFGTPKRNTNVSISLNVLSADLKVTQPYWLQLPMDKGHFNVTDQRQIGMAENEPPSIEFSINIDGTTLKFRKPIRYKYTDPVKGELYQPISLIPVAEVKYDKDVYLAKNIDSLNASVKLVSKLPIVTRFNLINIETAKENPAAVLSREQKIISATQSGAGIPVNFVARKVAGNEVIQLNASVADRSSSGSSTSYNRIIKYDHIPSIVYQKEATAKAIFLDLRIEGHLVGYIPGAGDKIPEALVQMGYKVVILTPNDLTVANLKQFDAIVTGVRAYNTQEWLNEAYPELMNYIKEGGVLLVQYNTNNSIGPVKAKIAPYPFTISRNRITDEEAKVNFLLPEHPALNYPNKITQKDFDGWIQERSTYHAEAIDSNYKRILSMKDPGETEQDGSLIVANYGKGRFVYAGLVFFRELPAGVPGAYRLFANLIANKRTQYIK